jgi:hypothetical protein
MMKSNDESRCPDDEEDSTEQRWWCDERKKTTIPNNLSINQVEDQSRERKRVARTMHRSNRGGE